MAGAFYNELLMPEAVVEANVPARLELSQPLSQHLEVLPGAALVTANQGR